MSVLPNLNFPSIRLKARRCGDKVEVWDPIRWIWRGLGAEGGVSQALLCERVWHCGVRPLRMGGGDAGLLDGQQQRADVVVVDDAGRPLLLAECKAPDVVINRQTLAQAVRYNSVLQARYIILTNGLKHYCCTYRDGQYEQLQAFPRLDGC